MLDSLYCHFRGSGLGKPDALEACVPEAKKKVGCALCANYRRKDTITGLVNRVFRFRSLIAAEMLLTNRSCGSIRERAS